MSDNSGGPTAPKPSDMGSSPNAPQNRFVNRAGNRCNNRGRWNNSNNGFNRFGMNKFEEREPTLKGIIYDYTIENNPDQFMKTMKEIISYVGRTYTKCTADFTQAVRDLKLEELSKPLPPQDTTDVIAMERWKYRFKEHKTKVLEYLNFKASLYSAVHGQCTDALQEKLKSHPDFDGAYKNGIKLLKIIKLLSVHDCVACWWPKSFPQGTAHAQQFVAQLNDKFGRETPISESYGKIHDYLGMTLDYSKLGEVQITMRDYIKLILHDVPDDMEGVAATPAGNHLFKVNKDNPEMLTGKRKETFVHIVMQLLYLSQQAKPDIWTAVSFLCGRLNKPDTDDYRKTAQVVKFLRGTLDLLLVLHSDGSGIVWWWVDASFVIHPDMKGHTGGTLSVGFTAHQQNRSW